MKISPARTAAFDILMRIETERAYSSILLPVFEAELMPVDRALCHELTLGTLRRQLYLDKIIEKLANAKKLDIEIRVALRLALYQLIYLDKIPQYSAINESVNLVGRARKTSAKGFVNAVLRRAAREKVELSFSDDAERLSVETSHPRWLVEKWIGGFGIAKAEKIARSNNDIPQTSFRIIGELNVEGRSLVDAATRSGYVEGCYVTDSHDPRLFELARRGLIYLQDEASQMVAAAVEIPADGKILDVCAAPGGKIGMIARRFSTKTRLAAAGDLYWPRVDLLRDNCRNQQADNVKIIQYNAEKALPFGDESFNVVLVDAPCSGTGTIRRNPELRYLLKPADFTGLSRKQLSILNNASKLVSRGGTIIYSTCSIENEENEDVADKFLSGHTDFGSVIPDVAEEFVTQNGFARTWPHRDNMDGFFIAKFVRRFN